MFDSQMTSTKPYLVRAIYDWIVDNAATVYIVVDAEADGASVPLEYVKDGRITLNASPKAIKDLVMDNDGVSFHARFSGVSRNVMIPINAILAVYAKENGQGMVFENEDDDGSGGGNDVPPTPPKSKDKTKGDKAKVSHLRRVK